MESTLVKYGKLSTNTVDGKLPSKEDGGAIYVQHNCLSVLNIHRVPVTVGMKGLMYPYNHVTKYVSKLYLNFRGCFKCVEIRETDGSVSCPKYPLVTSIHEVMDRRDQRVLGARHTPIGLANLNTFETSSEVEI